MEDDGLSLDLPVLDVYLVSAEDNGDVLADTDQIPVPVGDVLVGHTGRHVKHDDGTLSLKHTTQNYELFRKAKGRGQNKF